MKSYRFYTIVFVFIATIFSLILNSKPALAEPLANNNLTAVVNVGALNVRSGPGVNHDVVGVVYYGNTVNLLGRSHDSSWVKIDYDYSQTGWVSSSLIHAYTSIYSLAVVEQYAYTAAYSQVSSTVALNVRSGPGVDYYVIGNVFAGHPVTVLGQSYGWLNVQLSNGQQGWISSGYTQPYTAVSHYQQPVATNNSYQATINTGALNIRSGAGIQFYSIGVLYRGDGVTINYYNYDNSWANVYAKGYTGWVRATYLSNQNDHYSHNYYPPHDETPSCSYQVVLASELPAYVAGTEEAHGLPRARVNTGNLNVRTTPSIDGETVNVLAHGDTVFIVRKAADSNWVLVWLTAGNEGWVNACYLQGTVALDQLPTE